MPLEQMDYPASYAALRPVVEHEYFDHRAVPQLEEYLEEQVRRWEGGGVFFLVLAKSLFFFFFASLSLSRWLRSQSRHRAALCIPHIKFSIFRGKLACGLPVKNRRVGDLFFFLNQMELRW